MNIAPLAILVVPFLVNKFPKNPVIIADNNGIKITSKYQGTQVSAERWVKREAGENPAQCRCCVSGVVFVIIGKRIPRRGKPRKTLQSEDLPVYDAQKNLPGFWEGAARYVGARHIV